MAMAAMVAPAPATAVGRLRVPGPVGTVDTIAGPEFCSTGAATPDPASLAVGAVAAHPTDAGAVWYEAGAPDKGRITRALTGRGGQILFETGLNFDDPAAKRGPGLQPLRSTSRLASDPGGGVIIGAERGIHHLKDGGTSTLAGIPLSQSAKGVDPAPAGDGGPYAEALFRHVAAVATDLLGNIYVADEVDAATSTIAIRFLNRSEKPVVFYPGTDIELAVAPGTIETIAGTPETKDRLPRIPDLVAAAPVLAVSGDRLYLAAAVAGPRPRATVRVLNLGGGSLSAHGKTVKTAAMATVATVDGGPRPSGSDRVSPLPGIAVDAAGNLFLAERATHRVRRLSPTGKTTAFAGTGVAGFNGNGQPALEARLDLPYDVDVSSDGRVYISDAGNSQVRYIDRGGLIHAAPGAGAATEWVCSKHKGTSPVEEAAFGSPSSVANDTAGNTYVASLRQKQIFRVSPSGSVVPVAGILPSPCTAATPAGCGIGADGPAHKAFVDPWDLTPGPGGGLYVLETSRVRFLNTGRRPITVQGVAVEPGAIRTVAGIPPSPSEVTPTTVPDPLAASRQLAELERQLAAPPPPTGAPQSAVGSRALGVGPVHGRFSAVVADGRGHLFIAEVSGPRQVGRLPVGATRIREVDTRGVVVREMIGGDEDSSRCCFRTTSFAVDHRGNLYIGVTAFDSGGQVWYLNRSTAAVNVHGVAVAPGSTERVAGHLTFGVLEEGEPALTQRVTPEALAVDPSGNLYVASTISAHSVYRVDGKGSITTVAGTGQPGFNGDGLKGPLTAFKEPADVRLDPCGNLLIADFANHRLRRLNLAASCQALLPASPTAGRQASSWALVVVIGLFCAGTIVHLTRRRRRAFSSRPATAP